MKEFRDVSLVPLDRTHIASYVAHFSRLVQQFLGVNSRRNEHAYICQQLEERTFFWCIVHAGKVIGAIQIRNRSHAGQLYCWLHEDYWGSGIFTYALRYLLTVYFARTQEEYITAHVDHTNLRSYFALKKCGFFDAGVVSGPRMKQYELIKRS